MEDNEIKLASLEAGLKRDEAFYGLQAGVGNVAETEIKRVYGAQVGLISCVDGNAYGAQVSGFISAADKILRGAQITGLVSFTEEAKGAQVSGVISIAEKRYAARRLAGWQA